MSAFKILNVCDHLSLNYVPYGTVSVPGNKSILRIEIYN